MELVSDFLQYLPASIVAAGGLTVMMLDGYKARSRTIYTTTMMFLGVALAFATYDLFYAEDQIIFSGMAGAGGTAAFGTFIVVFGTFFTVILTHDYLVGVKHNFPQVYPMIMFCTFGMIVLATATDLVTVFVGLETMSICLYALAGILKDKRLGVESALKYFIMGAFSTGFFLYGISLLYGATGSTSLEVIGAYTDGGLIYWGGVSLLLVAFMFKISAVPFHMWTPDVYTGSPTTITAYMSTAGKTASFVALVLVLDRALPNVSSELTTMFSVIAVMTMVLGNVVAMVQDNVKRMLAYSSIAHVGYLLVGLAAGTVAGYSAVLFYLLAYTFMNVGAFGVVAYYEKNHDVHFNSVESYAGLGYQKPIMGVLLSIFLFSLAGIPISAGFNAKYLVFSAGIEAGLVGLVIVGVLASAASAYYYLRVMVYLYFREGKENVTLMTPKKVYSFSLVFLAVLTLYFGVVPAGVTELIFGFFSEGGIVEALP
ncbi:MAG: NADH-quinone oxidoreductase subunit N [Balneolales bacterium]|nr:NADH-quinone oxidoreductase subunit N [Balneolales bacterium]